MNNSVFNKQTRFWILLWLAAGGAAVITYNGWALISGHCSLQDLMQIPRWGAPLLSANLAAAAMLCILCLKRPDHQETSHCAGCCPSIQPEWSFCPLCGARRVAIKNPKT